MPKHSIKCRIPTTNKIFSKLKSCIINGKITQLTKEIHKIFNVKNKLFFFKKKLSFFAKKIIDSIHDNIADAVVEIITQYMPTI